MKVSRMRKTQSVLICENLWIFFICGFFICVICAICGFFFISLLFSPVFFHKSRVFGNLRKASTVKIPHFFSKNFLFHKI